MEDFHGGMWKLNFFILDFSLCVYISQDLAFTPEVTCVVHLVLWSFFLSETLIVFSGCLELMRQMPSIKKQFKNMLLISMSSVNELI